MNGSSKTILLIVDCWMLGFGIYFSLGIFFPKLRGRWGRGGWGAPLSLVSQILWALLFIGFGAGGFLSAYHKTWLGHAFPYLFFPLFICLMIMGWRDNRNFKRNEKDKS
jgi:hypothetical protein